MLQKRISEHAVCCIPPPCNSEGARRFGGEHTISVFPPASADFLLCLLFDPEARGDMFLRNLCLSPGYRIETPCSSPLSSDSPLLQFHCFISKLSGFFVERNIPNVFWFKYVMARGVEINEIKRWLDHVIPSR